jgi:hypothetical protein
MDEINIELKDGTNKTAKYKENELSWEEILDARDKLSKDSIEYVVMCLYTLMPPRRNTDYIMKVGAPQETGNWYNGNLFYFNNFKTAGKYKQQIVEPSMALKNVLDEYLVERPFKSNDLLIKKSGKPFTSKDIQLTINKVLGKKIGCTMLRSIYLSNKYGDVMQDMKEDAENMATSTGVIQSNYVKK